jgi:signal transduction histidine kinase
MALAKQSEPQPGRRSLDARNRAALYLVTALLAIAAIIWTESDVWKAVSGVRQSTRTISSDRFHLSDEFESKLRELNDDVFRYSLAASPERRAAIEAEAEQLRRWLADERAAAMSSAQAGILARAETLYSRYTAHASQVWRTNVVTTPLETWRAENEAHTAQLLSLARELKGAEKSALATFITDTDRSTGKLHRKLIVSSLVLVLMGSVLGYVVYFGIVAPLRSRLRQSQKVLERQEKLSSLGVLAAGVAHEIRNPLTSIKARLFTQKSLLENNSEAWEDNVFITGEISRLETIVKDFLAFARPSEPQMVPLQLSSLVHDLEPLFRPSLAKASIELKRELLADPLVSADPAQLKQVLINLVQNAAESIGRDGTITLRTRIEKRRRATCAILEVQDTGKGIPPEARQRLFDPFFTTKPSGTGLGLSIAARILEKHRGNLEYQTELNRGTTFRLVLPVAANT